MPQLLGCKDPSKISTLSLKRIITKMEHVGKLLLLQLLMNAWFFINLFFPISHRDTRMLKHNSSF